MTRPTLDLSALEATARAATPGPWTVASEDIWTGEDGAFGIPLYRTDRGQDRSWGEQLSDAQRDANAAHIAAFDPPTALELIALAKRAEKAEAEVYRQWTAMDLIHRAAELLKTDNGLGQTMIRAQAAEAREAKLRSALEDLQGSVRKFMANIDLPDAFMEMALAQSDVALNEAALAPEPPKET